MKPHVCHPINSVMNIILLKKSEVDRLKCQSLQINFCIMFKILVRRTAINNSTYIKLSNFPIIKNAVTTHSQCTFFVVEYDISDQGEKGTIYSYLGVITCQVITPSSYLAFYFSVPHAQIVSIVQLFLL